MAEATHSHDHDHAHHDHGCQHAHDRKAGASEIMARAEAHCARTGTRMTPIRRAVLAQLVGDHRPLGAYDLVERVSKSEGRQLAPISVYRALDFLVENEMAHRLTSRNAFIACAHHHHAATSVVFLICETCGGVDEIMTAGVASALDEAAAKIGFAPQRRMIEISGHCGHCKHTSVGEHAG
jgi:Fur family transcriptional regulator, zinc uptake regulator